MLVLLSRFDEIITTESDIKVIAERRTDHDPGSGRVDASLFEAMQEQFEENRIVVPL